MKRQLRLLLLSLALLGCTAETRHAAPQGNSQPAIESQRLRQMLEDYFEEFLKLAPLFATSIGDYRYDDQLAIVISEEQRGRRGALYRNYQSKIATIPRDRLEAVDQLILAGTPRRLTTQSAARDNGSNLVPLMQQGLRRQTARLARPDGNDPAVGVVAVVLGGPAGRFGCGK